MKYFSRSGVSQPALAGKACSAVRSEQRADVLGVGGGVLKLLACDEQGLGVQDADELPGALGIGS